MSTRATAPPAGEEAGRIADLMVYATRRIHGSARAELAPVGLTHAQSRALHAVTHACGPIRMADIATTLGIVPRAATTVIDALEEAGLVCRHPDPADRRAILIELTPKGRRLREQLDRARARAADAVLQPLTRAERQELLRLLSALCGPCCDERNRK